MLLWLGSMQHQTEKIYTCILYILYVPLQDLIIFNAAERNTFCSGLKKQSYMLNLKNGDNHYFFKE